MPGGYCCVVGCSSRTGHLFPKDKKRRQLWAIAVKRDKWKPTDQSLVCRKHFRQQDYRDQTDSLRERKRLTRDAVPSVFPWSKVQSSEQMKREKRKQKRDEMGKIRADNERKAAAARVEIDNAFQSDLCVGSEEVISSTFDSVDCECDITDKEDFSTHIHIPEAELGKQKDLDPTSMGKKQGEDLSESETVKKSETVTNEPYLSVDAIKGSDKLVHFYTGLESFGIFMAAFWSLGDNVNHLKYCYSESCSCLSPENQFLLMLVKLRRHYPHFELGRMFGVSDFSVQNIFVTWINFCYLQWSEINWWPERGLVRYNCPTDFKKKFPSTRVILDATEIRVKQPSNPRSQKASFSAYKHGNTMKVLVGVTPGGLTSYISDAYAGSTSDRQIVERSGLVHLCEKGDSIMADKGFNVQDIFAPKDILVNIPAFFRKKNRLAARTLQRDRKIASKRVHVERIIGMAKVYTICQHRLNILETKLATQIISVCFFLCNFRKTIVSRFA